MEADFGKLSDIIKDIEKELEELDQAWRRLESKKELVRYPATTYVLRLYNEIAWILKRIDLENKRFSSYLEKNLGVPPQFKSDFGSEETGYLSPQSHLNPLLLLRLDIKCLYLWIKLVYNIFHRGPIKISNETLKKLHNSSFIRDKLIEHPLDKGFFQWQGRSDIGIVHYPDREDFEVLFQSWPGSKIFPDIHEEFLALVDTIRVYIPSLKDASGFQDGAKIIHRNLQKIVKKEHRKLAEAFIAKVGTSSESPRQIAFTLLTALKEYRSQYESSC